ncbi:hypothetical protein APY03_3533 [Variovorax sp. WDL1]|nr:hypothetical protein APY03_3533 [Variovorax sp. WDL1]
MGIHLPIQPVQGVKRNRAASAVEHRDARMPRALGAAPHRRQVRRVLGEHQLRVPLLPILAGVVAARQPAQVAVERRHLVVLAHRLQAGVEHHVREIQPAPVQFRLVAPAQVEREGASVELVRAADQRARLMHVLERLFRRQRLANGFFRQMVEIRFEDILRCGDHRQTHRRVFGHLVEQRIDRIAFAGLAGQVPGARRHAQPVGDQHAMRHAVEVPGPLRHVRARLTEEQPLAEIPPARQFNLAGLDLVWIARQRVEALPVLGPGPEQRGMGVEPAQQPIVNVCRAHAPGLDAGVRQPAAQAVADDAQHLLGRLPAAVHLALSARAAVHHHAHTPRLAAPTQPRDRRILEQPARLGHRAQVVAEETQVELGERRAAGAGLHIVAQRLHVLVEAGLVLGVELEHPRVLVQFIETVLQRVFQGVAGVGEPARLPTLGAQRHQLEEGGHGLAVLQEHGFRLGQKLHPGQQLHEGRRDVVQRLLVGHSRRPAALDRGAGFGDAGLLQGLDVALPAVRLLVITRAGCGQVRRGRLRPGKFPPHQ